jgi:bifunctional DNase/RNase
MSEELNPQFGDDMSKPPPFFPMGPDREEREADREIRMDIEGFYDLEHPTQPSQRVIMLSDDTGRTVRMVIGAFEWLSIQMAKENDYPDRPFTHDLIRSIIDRLGYAIERIVIDDLWRNVYYAKMFLRKGDEVLEFDSRPSDAIAMATRYSAPIYMAESVLEASQAAEEDDEPGENEFEEE